MNTNQVDLTNRHNCHSNCFKAQAIFADVKLLYSGTSTTNAMGRSKPRLPLLNKTIQLPWGCIEFGRLNIVQVDVTGDEGTTWYKEQR